MNGSNVLRLIIQISRGLLQEARWRRNLMFYVVLAALVELFFGATILEGWLKGHPWWFLLYWGACAWLTGFALLLAIFDLLMVRAAARQAKREMENKYFKGYRGPDDENPA